MHKTAQVTPRWPSWPLGSTGWSRGVSSSRLGLDAGRFVADWGPGAFIASNKGVYAVGHRRLTGRGHWMAAVLACGPGALLSHRSGAAHWDMLRDHRSVVDVTAPGRTRYGRAGIVVHRPRCLHPGDRTVHDGIPVTSVARTLLDLAEELPPRPLERAFEEAERPRILDMRAVARLCERRRGHHGLKPLLHLLHSCRSIVPETRSDLEIQFLDLCRDHGLPPPAVNVMVAGYEVDAFWPRGRLVVELDSRTHHQRRAAFEEDRVRDAALQLAGHRVLRVTYRRLVNEARAVAETVRSLLASATP